MSDYGSAAGVALIARKYANQEQAFTATTTPTLTEVNTWLDQVCAQLNMSLADARFSTPVTAATVTPALDMFVNRQVANMVESLHLSKRAGPVTASNRNRSATLEDILSQMPAQVDLFVRERAGGLEAMGASRGTSQTVMGSVAMTRTDGYSDDVDSWENDL